MKRYSKYKDSGIEWLGEIPEHWDLLPLQRFININLKTLNEDTLPEYEIEYIDIGNVDERGIINPPQKMKFKNAPSRARRVIKQNDTIISTVRTYLKAIAFIGENKNNLIASTGFAVLTPKENTFPKYLTYLISSHFFVNQISADSKGVNYPAITSLELGKLKIAVTNSIEEQKKIVYFIDHKLEQINHFISNKQRLIELLKEQKTAIINRAVTKGLNPHAPMKPSGIEWLGEIPEHWKQIKIKYVLHKIIDTEHKTAPFYENGQYLVVRTSNIKGGILDFTNAKYTNLDGFLEWTRRGKPEPGDILFTREAPAGEACLVPQRIDLCLGQRVVLFRVNHQKLNEDFGVYSIYGGIAAEFIKLLSQGATVPHFNMSDITNIPLLLPPINEQKQIVQYIKNQSFIINEAIIKIEKEIELIKEYRTTLISDAVTGKIDVRI